MKVLLVAGSHSPLSDLTETLTIGDSSWQTAGSLPYAAYGIRGVSIGNKVFVTGEFSIYTGKINQIFKYHTYVYHNSYFLKSWRCNLAQSPPSLFGLTKV